MDLRAALAAKQGNETHFDLQVAPIPLELEERLRSAQASVRLAALRGEPDRAAEDEQAEAEAALRECFYRLRFRNIPPHEFEALLGAHEATKEQQAKGEVWNVDTLTPALLFACAVDSDLTEQEWQVELKSDRWTAADVAGVFRAAMDANTKPRSEVLPKG